MRRERFQEKRNGVGKAKAGFEKEGVHFTWSLRMCRRYGNSLNQTAGASVWAMVSRWGT